MAEVGTHKVRLLTGVVISDKMQKTVVVESDQVFKDGRFGKYLLRKARYKVHDAQQSARVGDLVEFYEGRPASKTKRMYLARILKSAETTTKSTE